MYKRPIITLVGNGDEITLDGLGDGFTLKPGSTGLGMAPVESTRSPLASGGSVTRHRRDLERDIMIPIDVWAPTYGELEVMRRRLENLCAADVVEIRVESAVLGVRSAFAEYESGLEGEFAWATGRTGQTIALTFSCPDPWWFGGEQGNSWALNRIVKPLITDLRVPFLPVFIAPSVVQGAFEFSVAGDAPATPVWTVYPPGEDLLIECENGCGKRLFFEGPVTEPITFDAGAEDITSPNFDRGELWDNVSLDSEFFDLAPGVNRVRISMVGTNAASRVVLSYREKYKAGH